MLPWKEKILTCPFCGQEKWVMTLLSYNTFGAIQRSDMKMEMHFNVDVSPVQKCPKCWKYYFMHNQEWREWENESFELWTLSYPEAKEAVEQLLSDDLDIESKKLLYITFLHSYNDWFVRDNENDEHKETAEDFDVFHKIIGDWLLLSALKREIELDPIFMWELIREVWDFDFCLDFFKDAKNILKDRPEYLHVIDLILERAENKDRKVFPLN